MMEGKIPENVLKRSILKEIQFKKTDEITGAAFGEDCAILNCKKNGTLAAAASFGLGVDGAEIAVIKAANNLAACGYKIKYVLVSLILPVDAEEDNLKAVERAIKKECDKLGALIIGGHTEVRSIISANDSDASVDDSKDAIDSSNDSDEKSAGNKGRIAVNISAMGIPFDTEERFDYSEGKSIESDNEKILPNKKSIKPGDSILVTKSIGLEGTYLILKEKKDEIEARFGKSFTEIFDVTSDDFSIIEEAKAATSINVKALKDVSEHGIFGALWELADIAGCGLRADVKAIPARQEVIEICNFYDINPYELKSSGMLLIVCDNPEETMEKLNEKGIECALIGEFTNDNNKIVTNKEDIRHLEKIKQDEIYKVLK